MVYPKTHSNLKSSIDEWMGGRMEGWVDGQGHSYSPYRGWTKFTILSKILYLKSGNSVGGNALSFMQKTFLWYFMCIYIDNVIGQFTSRHTITQPCRLQSHYILKEGSTKSNSLTSIGRSWVQKSEKNNKSIKISLPLLLQHAHMHISFITKLDHLFSIMVYLLNAKHF